MRKSIIQLFHALKVCMSLPKLILLNWIYIIIIITGYSNCLLLFKFHTLYESGYLIGWFVPHDTGLWWNNLLDVITVV